MPIRSVATYKIASAFTPEERRYACKQEYDHRPISKSNLRDLIRVTEDGDCPLGRLLEAADPGGSQQYPLPSASNARAILHSVGREVSVHALAAFCRNWDSGRITNLCAALGVEEKEAHHAN